jgi:hypothetical protein
MSEFKSLPLDRESIHPYVSEFVEQKSLRIDGSDIKTQDGVEKSHRYTIGKPQMQPAIIDFLCNGDGTTTVHYRIGKNQELGHELASFVKGKINPNEFESIEMTLQHLSIEDVMPIFNKFKSETYADDTKVFEYRLEIDSDILLQIRVTSSRHQDYLVLKYHKSAKSFQIQGKPLFVYKKLSYLMVDLLDLWGIEKVLSRKDDNRTEFISQEVAGHTLKSLIPDAYEKLPLPLKKLMVSGMCIALASPKLPDYSILLYPELRSLEGCIFDCLNVYGLYTSNYTDNGDQRIGVMFQKNGEGCYSLKKEYCEKIQNTDMICALESAYNQYTGKRHPLFHVEEELIFSKFISNLDVAMHLLGDIRVCINELYKFKP